MEYLSNVHQTECQTAKEWSSESELMAAHGQWSWIAEQQGQQKATPRILLYYKTWPSEPIVALSTMQGFLQDFLFLLPAAFHANHNLWNSIICSQFAGESGEVCCGAWTPENDIRSQPGAHLHQKGNVLLRILLEVNLQPIPREVELPTWCQTALKWSTRVKKVHITVVSVSRISGVLACVGTKSISPQLPAF